MQQTTAVTQDTVSRSVEGPISRRMLLAGSAGLVGAAAMAARPALAQGTPPAALLPIQAPVRQDWLDKRHEEIIEPGLPIIDPHHHLWDRPGYRYLFPELLADIGSGHNIRATCYEQAREMYRADGPEELKSLGETEFVSGVSAMSASGKYGATRCITGIIGFVDLRVGSRAKGILERHIAVSDGRLRGIRNGSTWSDDPTLKTFTAGGPPGLLLDKTFREGFATLAPLSLTFDAWMFQTQLADVVDLARAFPQTTIVLNHCGAPLAIGPYTGKREEAFTEWRDGIRVVAGLPNTYVKLGGLGMKLSGFTFFDNDLPPSSEDLEKAWRPYIETCIAAFGPQRSMFESNFPVDKGTCSYQVLWNAFKRLAAGYSADEKAALFSGAASKAYRLQV
jgi:predicted TIM-barrel fold metal-dependent hydrolase